MGKLYIVEGIPGSGKTTTATWLADILQDQGNDVKIYLEGNSENPADYESISCLSALQLKELEKDFPDIRSYATQKQNRFFIPYGNLYEKNPHLHHALKAYDVYGLPIEDFCEVTLAKWKEFVEMARSDNDVYVLECCFLQNPYTFLLAKHDVPKEQIFNHIDKITGIIAELDPVILYFEQDNIEESLNSVRKDRSKEWFEFLTWYYTEQSYGQARNLQGEAGVIQFLKERKELEKETLAQLRIKSLLLNNSEYDWEKRKEEILAFIR
ncbi:MULTISPECIES: hypothetical protein [unclassified Bacillus (in: firmicutes)]|uniref:hypothetical protein n=1 Tax=unclassified Bacillus (in: firmicutes) TaxID=185979 RepID=UPI0008EFEE99|nr:MULTISPECIES: hypothetical protein [unclassified Bacillus (in: firmicutes)]SFB09454.1 hypothetical protein SAMN02799634_105258 [Bacillus sp. UNCCL13]SFQ86697.1 hypothetical protein SAMN04488577_2862 [Bacillus sp. cl95]